MNRRRLLAACAGAASLAGCVGGGSPTEASDPWLSRERLANGVRGRLRLRRGEFLPRRVVPEGAADFRLRARERLSLPIDVMTFDAEGEAVARYRAGEPVDPIGTYSLLGVTEGRIEARIPGGEYAVVVDNTRLGEARPFDEVDVAIELRLA